MPMIPKESEIHIDELTQTVQKVNNAANTIVGVSDDKLVTRKAVKTAFDEVLSMGESIMVFNIFDPDTSYELVITCPFDGIVIDTFTTSTLVTGATTLVLEKISNLDFISNNNNWVDICNITIEENSNIAENQDINFSLNKYDKLRIRVLNYFDEELVLSINVRVSKNKIN